MERFDFQDCAIILEALSRYSQFWRDEYHKSIGSEFIQNGPKALEDLPGPALIAKSKLDHIANATAKLQDIINAQ